MTKEQIHEALINSIRDCLLELNEHNWEPEMASQLMCAIAKLTKMHDRLIGMIENVEE